MTKAAIPKEARVFSQELIANELKRAFQDYYHVKGSAKEFRDSSQEQLAQAIAETGNTKKETMPNYS